MVRAWGPLADGNPVHSIPYRFANSSRFKKDGHRHAENARHLTPHEHAAGGSPLPARTPLAQARSGSGTGGESLQIQYQEHYRLKCDRTAGDDPGQPPPKVRNLNYIH